MWLHFIIKEYFHLINERRKHQKDINKHNKIKSFKQNKGKKKKKSNYTQGNIVFNLVRSSDISNSKGIIKKLNKQSKRHNAKIKNKNIQLSNQKIIKPINLNYIKTSSNNKKKQKIERKTNNTKVTYNIYELNTLIFKFYNKYQYINLFK